VSLEISVEVFRQIRCYMFSNSKPMFLYKKRILANSIAIEKNSLERSVFWSAWKRYHISDIAHTGYK
jgi:hypothetical protein